MNRERTGTAPELAFRVGLALKGVDGLVELATGLLLWLAPEVLRSLATAVFDEPDNGAPAGRIIEHWAGSLGASLAAGAPVGVIVFLLSHGIVKLALVYCLLRDYRWVYRPAVLILGLFALYQLVVLLETPTAGKAVVLLLDVVIIGLVWREWRSRRS